MELAESSSQLLLEAVLSEASSAALEHIAEKRPPGACSASLSLTQFAAKLLKENESLRARVQELELPLTPRAPLDPLTADDPLDSYLHIIGESARSARNLAQVSSEKIKELQAALKTSDSTLSHSPFILRQAASQSAPSAPRRRPRSPSEDSDSDNQPLSHRSRHRLADLDEDSDSDNQPLTHKSRHRPVDPNLASGPSSTTQSSRSTRITAEFSGPSTTPAPSENPMGASRGTPSVTPERTAEESQSTPQTHTSSPLPASAAPLTRNEEAGPSEPITETP
ncbi:flocculation protein FLO11-like [Zingiber officinale]|uniref:flocculation protein FLO11-like n=1 Tax=Zingiber officinale TaxID=94328 RepID=UPI001C4CE088|nr:flocculation protein FLO11-like [Zingiber officinale]